MPVLTLFLILVVLGVLVWALTSFIPMDRNIATLIRVVGVIIALIWVLRALGIIPIANTIHVPTLR